MVIIVSSCFLAPWVLLGSRLRDNWTGFRFWTECFLKSFWVVSSSKERKRKKKKKMQKHLQAMFVQHFVISPKGTWNMHSEYKDGGTLLALMNAIPCSSNPYNRPTNQTLPLPSVPHTALRELHCHQLKIPSGWLQSEGDGIVRNCKTIDWRATSLIKETLGLWFWGTNSTNFPKQPHILAFLLMSLGMFAKGFIFCAGETSTAAARGQSSTLTTQDGCCILRPSISNCYFRRPSRGFQGCIFSLSASPTITY